MCPCDHYVESRFTGRAHVSIVLMAQFPGTVPNVAANLGLCILRAPEFVRKAAVRHAEGRGFGAAAAVLRLSLPSGPVMPSRGPVSEREIASLMEAATEIAETHYRSFHEVMLISRDMDQTVTESGHLQQFMLNVYDAVAGCHPYGLELARTETPVALAWRRPPPGDSPRRHSRSRSPSRRSGEAKGHCGLTHRARARFLHPLWRGTISIVRRRQPAEIVLPAADMVRLLQHLQALQDLQAL